MVSCCIVRGNSTLSSVLSAGWDASASSHLQCDQHTHLIFSAKSSRGGALAPPEQVPLIFPELPGLREASTAPLFIFVHFGQNRKVQQGLGAGRALLCLFLFVVHKACPALFETARVLLIIGFQIQVLPAYLTLPVDPSSPAGVRQDGGIVERVS